MYQTLISRGLLGVCCCSNAWVRLIQETDLRHPIILSADGRVLDGMHRVARAYLEGHATIEGVPFEVDPEPDYIDVNLDDLPYDEST